MNFAQSLVKYCKHHTIPSTLVSDHGTHIKNDLVEGLITLLGTNHKFTFAYFKEKNGLLERVYKKVLRHMRNI